MGNHEHVHDSNHTGLAGPPAAAAEPRRRWRAVRDTGGAAVGTVLGIVPHVMHHIGLLAGAALISGSSGNVVLFAVGLLFSVPMLRRLYRHFRTLWAPAIAMAVFTGLFSLSAFVIGPAISGASDTPEPAPASPGIPKPTGQHGHTAGVEH